MTALTREQLEAMTDRELDAAFCRIVSGCDDPKWEVVFQPPYKGLVEGIPTYLPSHSLEDIIDAMRDKGFTFDIDSTVTASTDFTWHSPESDKVWRVTGDGEDLSRLAAIATVLACQEAG